MKKIHSFALLSLLVGFSAEGFASADLLACEGNGNPNTHLKSVTTNISNTLDKAVQTEEEVDREGSNDTTRVKSVSPTTEAEQQRYIKENFVFCRAFSVEQPGDDAGGAGLY